MSHHGKTYTFEAHATTPNIRPDAKYVQLVFCILNIF